MLRLLEFLYKRRLFILFLVLEGLSFWLLFRYNNRYNSFYLNTSNRAVGQVTQQITSVNRYFNLEDANDQLAAENLELRKLLGKRTRQTDSIKANSDSAQYTLSLAKVINSSFRHSRNYVTLRINPEDSIVPGMGVISGDGVIGRVKSVSSHYATAVSVLNPSLMISGKVKKNEALCTVQWEGEDPTRASLKYVSRHLRLNKGDTIVTSGFDMVFPNGTMIGIVDEADLRIESPFYDAKVRLSTDFTTLNRAYLVDYVYKNEKEVLEEEVIND